MEAAIRTAMARARSGDINVTCMRVRKGSPVHEFVKACEAIRKEAKPGQAQAVKILIVDELPAEFELVLGV